MTNVPAQYQGLVNQAASTLGIPSSIVAAQINMESGFNPNAVSPTGAQGIAQFEPGTWAGYGQGSPFDPTNAFAAYTKFMASLLRDFGGDVRKALAGYNAGPGNIQAGMGYANSILSQAGTGDVTVNDGGAGAAAGGLGGNAPGLGGPTTQAQAASVIQAINALFAGGGGTGLPTAQAQIDTIVGGNLPAAVQGAIGMVSGAISWLDGPLKDLQHLVQGVLWLTHPSNWLRIFAGIVGGLNVIAGAVLVARSA